MAEIILGRWQPSPGQAIESFEVPGPGTYEADFDVPGWLVPNFESRQTFTAKLGEHSITHLRSAERDGILTVRFRVERIEGQTSAPGIEAGPVLLLYAVMGVLGGAIIGYLGTIAFKSLRELRRIAETPAGFGLAALGIGAGAMLLMGAIKGK